MISRNNQQTTTWLLLVIYLLSSCGGKTNYTSMISPDEQGIKHNTDHQLPIHSKELPSNEIRNQLTNKSFITKGGHQIHLGWKEDQCMAQVTDKSVPGFSNTQTLPVRLAPDISWLQVTQMNEQEQKHLMHIVHGKDNQPAVVIEKMGLLGGGGGNSKCSYNDDDAVWDANQGSWVCPAKIHLRAEPYWYTLQQAQRCSYRDDEAIWVDSQGCWMCPEKTHLRKEPHWHILQREEEAKKREKERLEREAEEMKVNCQKQMITQLEKDGGSAMKSLWESLGISSRYITTETFVKSWLNQMEAINQGSTEIPKATTVDSSTQVKVDEFLGELKQAFSQEVNKVPKEYQAIFKDLPVESIRPYVTELVKAYEDFSNDEDNEIKQQVEELPLVTINKMTANEEKISQPSKLLFNKIKTGHDTKIAVHSTDNIFIPSLASSNVEDIRNDIEDIEERISENQSRSLLEDQKEDIKYILKNIHAKQEKITTLYRALKRYVGQRDGDEIFIKQDTSRYTAIEQAAFEQEVTLIPKHLQDCKIANNLLGELQKMQTALRQMLIDQGEQLSDYIELLPAPWDPEKDYSHEELVIYLTEVGNISNDVSSKEQAFITDLIDIYRPSFKAILQQVVETAPMSKQALYELLQNLPSFRSHVLKHYPVIEYLPTQGEEFNHITQLILQAMIQSGGSELLDYVQVRSLVELKKRIHNLKQTIHTCIQQPTLLLTGKNPS